MRFYVKLLVSFLLVLGVSSVAWAGEIPVSSYYADPPTPGNREDVINCDNAPWACDPDNTKLTDGVYPTGQWVDGDHACWYVDRGTVISIYLDLGSVTEVGAVGINYNTQYSPIAGDVVVLVTTDADPNTATWTQVAYNDEWAPRDPDTNATATLGIFESARWARLDFETLEPGLAQVWLMLGEVDFGEPNAIVITAQPEDTVLQAGDTATFTVAAETGSAYTLAYQWKKDGAPLSNGGDISGADSNSLSIANVDNSDVGEYSCVVSSDGWVNGVESDAADLIVVPPLSDYGQRVMYHLPLLYWSFDEPTGLRAVDLVSLLPERTISAPNGKWVLHGDFGNGIVITGGDDTSVWRSGSLGAGTYNGPFALELMYRNKGFPLYPIYIMEAGGFNHPSLLQGYPYGQTSADPYHDVWFYEAEGIAGTAYITDSSWHHLVFADYDNNQVDAYIDGVKVAGFAYGKLWADRSYPDVGVFLNLDGPTALGGTVYYGGAFGGDIEIDEVSYYDLSGLTEAQIAARGQGLALHTDLDGNVYISENPGNVTVPAGEDAVLVAAAAGEEPITYQWKKDGSPLSDGGNISGATTPVLTITSCQPGVDDGDYSISISGKGPGAESTTATVTMGCYYDITGDLNNDCVVDFKDFAEMAAHWLEDSLTL